MELAIAGEPLPVIVRTLAELAGHPVALEGRDGRVLTYAAVARRPERAAAESLLADGRDTASRPGCVWPPRAAPPNRRAPSTNSPPHGARSWRR